MLFSIVSVSAVCLALAINGWVPPDPHTSAVTSTGLVTFGQRWHQEDGHVTALSTGSIVKWLGYFLSPLDVVTEQNFEDICSCRPTQESDGNSLWLEYRTPRVTDLDPGVIWVTIDQLKEDITYGFDFAFGNLISVIKPADSIGDDRENAGNFLVATWRTTDTLPSIHKRDTTIRETLHRPHFFFYLGSWIPILPLFVMVVLRGKKKRVNTHYVYSIKDVQKALAKGRRRFGHRKKNSTQLLKPKQENKNLAEGNSQPHPAFGHGDFSQTFKIINGKLVVEKLRRDLD